MLQIPPAITSDQRFPSSPVKIVAKQIIQIKESNSRILQLAVCLMIDGSAQSVWTYIRMLSKLHAATICFVKDAFHRQLNALCVI